MDAWNTQDRAEWKDFQLFMLENGLLKAEGSDIVDATEVTARGKQVAAAIIGIELVKQGYGILEARCIAESVCGMEGALPNKARFTGHPAQPPTDTATPPSSG